MSCTHVASIPEWKLTEFLTACPLVHSVRNGHIKRITDQDIQSSVLEVMSDNVASTFITWCGPLDLKLVALICSGIVLVSNAFRKVVGGFAGRKHAQIYLPCVFAAQLTPQRPWASSCPSWS